MKDPGQTAGFRRPIPRDPVFGIPISLERNPKQPFELPGAH